MLLPGQLKIADYTYTLPEEKIALHPLPQRDSSKLLVYKDGRVSETIFTNLTQQLPENGLLVFNNTKVIPARLQFQKATGGHIEIFVLEPLNGEIATAMAQKGNIDYTCLVKKAVKWKSGSISKKKVSNGQEWQLDATLLSKTNDAFQIRFSWQPQQLSFAEILQAFGEMPIPPYLHRPADTDDAERYQTIYATHNGSVAAPTAGLHFTDAVLQSLHQKNIDTAYTTLHVGAGTFKPVKSETLSGHEMHTEWITVEKNLIEKLLLNKTVIPVGTTSLRTLESLYWLGLKTLANPQILPHELHLSQWEVYENSWAPADAETALQSLLNRMNKLQTDRLTTHTQILIAPGYTFKICKGLITNFHQPQSTLLLLIAALVGTSWKSIYQYALENNFRFLSYGDSSLLFARQ